MIHARWQGELDARGSISIVYIQGLEDKEEKFYRPVYESKNGVYVLDIIPNVDGKAGTLTINEGVKLFQWKDIKSIRYAEKPLVPGSEPIRLTK